MITTLEQFLSAWMQDAFCKALPGVDADWSTVAVVATTSAEFGDYQTGRLIDTFYSGKASGLVSALYHHKRLSAEDVAELRALLDREDRHE